MTRDIRTMPDFAHRRVAANLPMPGVVVIPTPMPIGAIIAELVLIAAVSNMEEWTGCVIPVTEPGS